MSLQIAAKTDFSEGLKSKLKEQCTEAFQLIASESENDPHDIIHEIRKRFKKTRGILRLIRDHIPFYKEENAFFRDEGRRLSAIRDTTSIIEALDNLYGLYEDQLYKHTFGQFRDYLIATRDQMTADLLKDRGVLTVIKTHLSAKCVNITHWPIDIQSFTDLSASIGRVYKRGRKGYAQAKEKKRAEDFHEWRKRVKYLRYQLDLLHRTWPGFLTFWEDELHDLSDYLGDDRDLFMLETEVEKNRNQFSGPESYQLLKSLINYQRAKLQTHALKLGKRLYHLKPKIFTELLRAAWEAFDSEAEPV
ncbi:CHAD domain-containing protein [Cyclobacterium salsum]|uniref:CHAD domain-containing protein n=1 Tax=Cyclobacterium salsum TaxID=2666329 RepID=UPI00139139A6|nr:CHAD domain-containing protein [Cyclobacterium salsum]